MEMIMKIHDEANRASRLTFKFISCCHDQNHNGYVVAIKMLENI